MAWRGGRHKGKGRQRQAPHKYGRGVGGHSYLGGAKYVPWASFIRCISLPLFPPDSDMLAYANFRRGLYRYTTDLLRLESATPPRHPLPYTGTLASPLRAEAWRQALLSIPDRAFTDVLLRGIAEGFRIGISDESNLRSAGRNLKSADDNPQVISDYLKREVALGRLFQLPPALTSQSIHISPCGAIPKKYKPGKWRLIVDLSSPAGHSINDVISKELSSVTYASLDTAVTLARALGRGCLLAKLDLKEAYRAVPVHPSDQRLLAIRWQDTTYIDRALPFGLCSAPKIFSALTDAMVWFLHERGVRAALHYLDDFLVLGPPGSSVCAQSLATTLALCDELGFPVAPDKTEGPTTSLIFLGIEVDTCAQMLRLPDDKRERLLAAISHWSLHGTTSPRRSGKKRELLSLIGLLSHAALAVRPGRAFCAVSLTQRRRRRSWTTGYTSTKQLGQTLPGGTRSSTFGTAGASCHRPTLHSSSGRMHRAPGAAGQSTRSYGFSSNGPHHGMG